VFDKRYEAQVRLLIRCLPEVSRHSCFALKGGTAINLFVRDLPRVSVDIDLTYLPLKPREEVLTDISEKLLLLKNDIEKHINGTKVRTNKTAGYIIKLSVSTPDAAIKVEPNLILRGAIYPPVFMDLCPAAQKHFGSFASVSSLSIPDLYGGKICAALDRQHPRDLFDVKLLIDETGITPEIRRAFVIYLAGHNRPINELLSLNLMDIKHLYNNQFAGMTRDTVTLPVLQKLQKELPGLLVQSLDNDERQFLLSMKHGEPEWGRLGIDNLEMFPSLQWKLMNIRKMDSTKRMSELRKLQKILL
jgi:predicted nucleotidyltransferase component of viral defense system